MTGLSGHWATGGSAPAVKSKTLEILAATHNFILSLTDDKNWGWVGGWPSCKSKYFWYNKFTTQIFDRTSIDFENFVFNGFLVYQTWATHFFKIKCRLILQYFGNLQVESRLVKAIISFRSYLILLDGADIFWSERENLVSGRHFLLSSKHEYAN